MVLNYRKTIRKTDAMPDDEKRLYETAKAAFERQLTPHPEATPADRGAYIGNIIGMLEKGALHLRALSANIGNGIFDDNAAGTQMIALFANIGFAPLALATRNVDRLVRAHQPGMPPHPWMVEDRRIAALAAGDQKTFVEFIGAALPSFDETAGELRALQDDFDLDALASAAFTIRTAAEIVQSAIGRFAGTEHAPEAAQTVPALRN